MLKTSPQSASTLSAIGVYDSKVVDNSSRKDRKLAKSDFTKPIYGAEDPNFPTPNTKQSFTQLGQVFTKALIIQHFDPKRYIRIKTDALGYAIGSILS